MAGVDYLVNMTFIRGNYEVSVVITSSLTAWGTRDLPELRTLLVSNHTVILDVTTGRLPARQYGIGLANPTSYRGYLSPGSRE